ncbi:MAG: hypothetical protein ACLQVF_13950 [Isosphaeraceae bacterium]
MARSQLPLYGAQYGGEYKILPSELSDRIEMGRRAVEFVGREPGGLVRIRTEVVPGRRLRGVDKLRSRLTPTIGQARRFGPGCDRRGRPHNRGVRILRVARVGDDHNALPGGRVAMSIPQF